MALNYSYGYTNTTVAPKDEINPIIIDDSVYAITVDDPGKCVMKNITSPIDQPEVITFLAQDKSEIVMTEKNQHPGPTTEKGARMVAVKVENYKRETSTTDDHYIVDYPIACTISWRFPKNRAITAGDLQYVLDRALGSTLTNDGLHTRLTDMIMEQLNPRQN